MNSKVSLAIVIPVYKIDFFNFVLDSLANQTDKNFNVYIGIDASRANFEEIIHKYDSVLNIYYKRFDDNLGGKNLVAQWNRCIDLIGDEAWIWLFSDDDIMEPNCVECFYKEVENGASYDLYHFNVDIINEQNQIVKHTKSYPDVIDSVTFLRKKNSARLDSFVVEYIFNRLTFEQLGGFQFFDLAWGTDIATWAKIGSTKGIKTITGSKVLWRQSSLNITPANDKQILIRKLSANVSFYIWCKEHFHEIANTEVYYYMFRMLFHYSPYLQSKDFKQRVKPLFKNTWCGQMVCWSIITFYPVIRFTRRMVHFSDNNRNK